MVIGIAGIEGDEELLMAVLNSSPISNGTVADELVDETDGRTWLRNHDLKDSPEEWRRLVEARELLWEVVRGQETPAALGDLIRDTHYVPTATPEGLSWHLESPPGREAAARIVIAWDDVSRRLPGRLRSCANPECRLFLLDRSKNNTGRWCSMAVCGNRMKARRHHAR